MASRIETDLIVKAIAEGFDKVIGELEETGRAGKKAGDEVGKGGDGAKKAGMKWTELRSAVGLAQLAFNQALGAAKQVYAFLQEGAAIDLAQTKFDRLAGSIGTTASALERDMGDAIGGMLSQSESMALASDLMSLGLAKTHDQTVRLSRVASSLNMDMNQLVLTLSNQTTMRFDSLGVAVDGFDDRLGELKATGMDVNDAFTEAFLQQAEEQITKVGEVSETAAGKLQILENQARDTGDAFKLSLLNAIEPVLDRHIQLIDAEQQLDRAFTMGAVGLEEYNRMQRELSRGGTAAAEAIVEHTDAMIEQRQAAYDAASAEDELRRQMSEGVTPAVREASQALLDYEARREGIWTQETLEIKFAADTEDLEGAIRDYSGRTINIPVHLGGGENQSLVDLLNAELQEMENFENRFLIAAEAELDEKQILTAFQNASSSFTSPEVSDFTIPVSPEIDPVGMLEDMEAGLIDVQGIIDAMPPQVTPEVDDQQLDDLVAFIDGDVSGSLEGVFGTTHMLETSDNLPVLDGKLQNTLNLINSIAGTHTIRFVTQGGPGNPYGGPYELPNGP